MSWEKVKVHQVFPLIRNGASIKQDENSGGIPITRIETIASGIINLDRLGYAGIESENYSEYYLKSGDILMSHINSWSHLGKTALVGDIDSSIIHGMNLLLLRTEKNLLDAKFAKYFFETLIFKNQLNKISNQSVNQSSFTVSKLKELEIPLPPLTIQKKIAEILDKAHALRKKDLDLLKHYDTLAQSLFIDMFGDPVRNNKGVSLSQVVKINPSKSEGVLNDDELVSFVGMASVGEKGEFDGSIVKIYSSVKSGFTYFKDGDILFAKITPCMENGKGAITKNLKNGIGFGSTEFHVFRPNEKITAEFIYHLLALPTIRKYAEMNMTGSAGQKRVGRQFFNKLKIQVPPISLQNQFAEQVKNIELQKEKVKKQIEASENLFQALLQKMFS